MTFAMVAIKDAMIDNLQQCHGILGIADCEQPRKKGMVWENVGIPTSLSCRSMGDRYLEAFGVRMAIGKGSLALVVILMVLLSHIEG